MNIYWNRNPPNAATHHITTAQPHQAEEIAKATETLAIALLPLHLATPTILPLPTSLPFPTTLPAFFAHHRPQAVLFDLDGTLLNTEALLDDCIVASCMALAQIEVAICHLESFFSLQLPSSLTFETTYGQSSPSSSLLPSS